MVELVDEPQRVVPQLAPLAFTQRVDITAIDQHLSGGRFVETAKNLQQRGLARA